MGWTNIYSAVYDEVHSSIFDISQRYGKQLLWIGASILIIIVLLITDSKFYSVFAYPIYGIGLLLLINVLFFGIEVNASKSWFQIGDFRVQPVEFTKITICLALAQFLSSESFSFKNPLKLSGLILILGLPITLIFIQNDTGSALVFFSFIFVLFREGLSKILFITAFALIVLFVLALLTNLEILLIVILCAGVFSFLLSSRKGLHSQIVTYSFLLFTAVSIAIYFSSKINIEPLTLILINIVANCILFIVLHLIRRNKNLIIFCGLIIGVCTFVYSVDYIFNNILQEHQRNRIDALLGKSNDPLGVDYNVNQSKIAIGSGGFSGKGFLQGTQTKYNFVPEQSTDFIFCTIGEEWGFLGTSIVLFLFAFLIIRIIFLAERQRSSFSRIYGYGLASILLFHVVINIGMTIGLAPVIGIPLPFFSYGGSSLWAFTIMLFIFIKLDSDRLQIFR
jgi:rod shape determining protein RodA